MPVKNELEYICIENSVASAKIALQGAHIFDYTLKGKGSVLFLSDTSVFNVGKAIRGGVPVCWPWFGAHKENASLPNHGFARTSLWTHTATQELGDNLTKVSMMLESSPQTLQLWPFHFRLTLDIYVGESLRLELKSDNIDTKPFDLSLALHTYLKVDDISKTKLKGLDGNRYYDKTKDIFETQNGTLDFTQEIDRIYQEVENDLIVEHDTQQLYLIRTEGSRSVVVWNPGKILADTMDDLSSHMTMLCIESANVLDDSVTLQPGGSHTLTHEIICEKV